MILPVRIRKGRGKTEHGIMHLLDEGTICILLYLDEEGDYRVAVAQSPTPRRNNSTQFVTERDIELC